MNDYNFDYLNYITNIPGNINYGNNEMLNPLIMPNNMPTQNINDELLDPYQGLIRGNLFKNQYDPYKNYKPNTLNPTSEKDTLLYQIMQYKFALIDLKLYLDTHPNNTNILSLYNRYLTIEKQMCDKFESMYGPLTANSPYIGNKSWTWNNSPWPWEGK